MPRLAARLVTAAAVVAAAFAIVPFTGNARPATHVEPARRGPPWISIEYPANPHDPASRGAFLLVNTFHHGKPLSMPIRGTAEGMVNGARRSQTLEFRSTSRQGVYALHRQWPQEGTWVLVISTGQSAEGMATALVSLGRDGGVASVEVPSRQQDGWTVPRPVTAAEVDALLARRVAAR